MTTTLRPLFGIVFAALLALSLVATTVDAIASTPQLNGGPTLFDQGFTNGSSLFRPRHIGRLGITWE